MPNTTTVPDVFAVAMQMEEIGKDFYQALALGCDDARVRSFCLHAARDEARHWAAFQQMRSQWRESAGRAPPWGTSTCAEAADSLAALARKQIVPDPQAVQRAAMGGSLADALALAIQMEQDSIRFYDGLVAVLPASADALSGIAAEERRHLGTLRLLAV